MFGRRCVGVSLCSILLEDLKTFILEEGSKSTGLVEDRLKVGALVCRREEELKEEFVFEEIARSVS